MRLAAIYNIWGDATEHLLHSVSRIRPYCEIVIFVVQERSNYGEIDDRVLKYCQVMETARFCDHIILYEPNVKKGGLYNEKAKRQAGINKAREMGATHFLSIDCDELYFEDEFEKAKEHIKSHDDIDGSYAHILTYYKTTHMRFNKLDNYYVPFITKLKPNTLTGVNKSKYKVDPTRSVSHITTPYLFPASELKMHHYSWVRHDIEKKVRNSTARSHIDKEHILNEYRLAVAGDVVKHYNNDGFRLTIAPNEDNPYYHSRKTLTGNAGKGKTQEKEEES